jgi:hypothetical protein
MGGGGDSIFGAAAISGSEYTTVASVNFVAAIEMTSVGADALCGAVGGGVATVSTDGWTTSVISTELRRVSKISFDPMRVSKLVAYGSRRTEGDAAGGSNNVTGSSTRVANSDGGPDCVIGSGCGQYGQN